MRGCPKSRETRRLPRGWATRIVLGCLALATTVGPLAGQGEPTPLALPQSPAEWEAAAAAFPDRVRRVPHPAATGTSRTPVQASRIEVRPGLDYLRIRDLRADLPVLAGALEAPRLIVDLRFVSSGLEGAIEFGRALARRPAFIFASGPGASGDSIELPPASSASPRGPGQLTLVLVNHGTSGPVEAVLDALQRAGEIILVGTATAGDATVFVDAPDGSGWQVRSSVLSAVRNENAAPVAVAPRMLIDVTDSDDATAYGALESGTELALLLDPPVEKPRFDEARLLRQFDDSTRRTPPPAGTGAAPSTAPAPAPAAAARANGSPVRPPFDRVLHRAVNTVIALEALGRLPVVSGNGS
jgi:hypothetical protein